MADQNYDEYLLEQERQRAQRIAQLEHEIGVLNSRIAEFNNQKNKLDKIISDSKEINRTAEDLNNNFGTQTKNCEDGIRTLQQNHSDNVIKNMDSNTSDANIEKVKNLDIANNLTKITDSISNMRNSLNSNINDKISSIKDIITNAQEKVNDLSKIIDELKKQLEAKELELNALRG